ncbi:MAG: hypothetical protein V4622_03585 [Bacteroidota bacterium]
MTKPEFFIPVSEKLNLVLYKLDRFCSFFRFTAEVVHPVLQLADINSGEMIFQFDDPVSANVNDLTVFDNGIGR